MKNKRTVSDFFDNEYLDYAKYVVEQRAIPSCIDGLKPTQRKIIYIADKIWKTGNEKPMKLFQLAGRVASDGFYHHGDASLSGAMIGMAQKFKNSMPLLDSIGQFGSLRDPSAGAPRYISTKLHPNFRLLYKDFELLKNNIEEGEEIEPDYFLPVIPTVILNGTSGIAVGFATKILNRDPVQVIDSCILSLNNKKIKTLTPYIHDFTGTFNRDISNPNKWNIKGRYEIKNTTTVIVSEIPPSYTYEKYEAHLQGLMDKKIITDYDDNSSGKVEYVIKFQRSILKEQISKGKLERTLKINSSETENLTTIDENGNLKIFERAEDIVKYFVNVRLGWYDVRKEYLINKIEKELTLLNNKARFIKDIIDGNLKINNIPRENIILSLETKKYDKIDNSYNYLLLLPIHTLTREKFNDLLNQVKNKNIELSKIKSIESKDMYINDLHELKKQLIKK